MKTKVTCPGCGKSGTLSGGAHITKFRCRRCNGVFAIASAVVDASVNSTAGCGPIQNDEARELADTDGIRIVCTKCGAKLRLKAHLAGKRVRCAKCEKFFLVPPRAAASQPSVSASESADSRAAHDDSETTPRFRVRRLVAVVLVICVAIIFVVLLSFEANRQENIQAARAALNAEMEPVLKQAMHLLKTSEEFGAFGGDRSKLNDARGFIRGKCIVVRNDFSPEKHQISPTFFHLPEQLRAGNVKEVDSIVILQYFVDKIPYEGQVFGQRFDLNAERCFIWVFDRRSEELLFSSDLKAFVPKIVTEKRELVIDSEKIVSILTSLKRK
jgi:hypothetical protein